MNVTENVIRERCTDAVFERGRDYRSDGRIRRIERFDDTVTATVRGSDPYDVTVELGGDGIDARCTCPYDGPGECKHVVAVLLDVASDDLRGFVRDALAENPDLREQFLARFGESGRSVDEYRAEIEALFDQHTRDYPVVTGAIDFSYFFDLAEQYRDRGRYLDAATVYRALFEGIDDNEDRIDGAYDHYAKALQSALDGYVDCVLAADPGPEEFEQYAGVLETQAMSDPPVNSERFRRALDDLEDRR